MSETPFHIDELSTDGKLAILPQGEIDIATAPQLAQRLSELQETGTAVILDLSGVSFMDSSGIGTLLRAVSAARENDWEFHVNTNAQPQVERVIQLSGIHAHIWPKVA